MTLVLEVEFLLGVAFAATTPDSNEPDWPPQPDRIFSALVSTWAVRGTRQEEKFALEWLESQEPPLVLASDYKARPAPEVYVPPNDAASGRSGNIDVLPQYRGRQPRRFPAALPVDPLIRYIWTAPSPDVPTLVALNALAKDTACIGHSASLTRCRFDRQTETIDIESAKPPEYVVYSGRLSELETAFGAGRRPSRGRFVAASPAADEDFPASVFGRDWIVLEHIDGPMPDLRTTAIIARRIRDTIFSGFGDNSVPEIISGHAPEGSPSANPHLAIVPLAFLGFEHADGHVQGYALVLPRRHETQLAEASRSTGPLPEDLAAAVETDQALIRALKAIGPFDERSGRRRLVLHRQTLAFGGAGSGRASLRPGRYLQRSRMWASATPILLDRHLKSKDPEERAREAESIVCEGCRNIGLPEPARVIIHKHSTIEGSPSAAPSGKSPRWLRWRMPEAYRTRTLLHAVIEFDRSVEGPVILGAGRHVGLGLCLPLRRHDS